MTSKAGTSLAATGGPPLLRTNCSSSRLRSSPRAEQPPKMRTRKIASTPQSSSSPRAADSRGSEQGCWSPPPCVKKPQSGRPSKAITTDTLRQQAGAEEALVGPGPPRCRCRDESPGRANNALEGLDATHRRRPQHCKLTSISSASSDDSPLRRWSAAFGREQRPSEAHPRTSPTAEAVHTQAS